MKDCDLIVVGGGHAGAEAAAAASRLGLSVCLVTQSRNTIAQMPCNPAIGGIGKGHLVMEMDALGGIQAWAADRAGIQFKVLNSSRGPAVWGPRAQCDKHVYSTIIARLLSGLRGLRIVEGEVLGLLCKDKLQGIYLADGSKILAESVILTTGTFLGAILHTGNEAKEGGRFGEEPSIGLGEDLDHLGFELRRFKTGTPPRLDRESIDYSRVQEQPGDIDPRPFSFRTRRVTNQILCWMSRTNEDVQQIIEENLDRSPLFSGVIDGVGPRYCPSIEDKVVRFPHHREHTVFIEPEGIETRSVYVNGLSTSLPKDIQERVVHAVQGLENAKFLRYGYAVEYDVIAPGQVRRTLESRTIDGLYFAGQLLGTSGYEEAAGLGLLAGINAAHRIRGKESLILGRENAYLGVMVDDLVRREHREPYRMLTSRAEHRLLLGIDSARERLMPIGRDIGLIAEKVFHVEQRRWAARRRVREELIKASLNPTQRVQALILQKTGIAIKNQTTWARLLSRDDIEWRQLVDEAPLLGELTGEDQEVVIGLLRYEGYRVRAERERDRVHRLRHVRIPESIRFREIPGLSREVVENLERAQPRTLADAEMIPGVTPAAVAIIAGRLSTPESG